MAETSEQGYRVLARKYRPNTFDDLVGQDAMVRTLRNAFEAGRIAQAFMMTGIRGTGKTSTARIIAKGMNCVGPDGTGGPTTQPCGQCDACRGIAEGRHVDVLEMDAASNTGIDDIRSLVLDTVAYAPSQARFKIFIIDEVHMLSKSAFNALLKTLEEPPAHVKFIFATTEINKVPVTVLSRCQRFDLRRIEPEVMLDLLRKIATAESAQITDDALALITRAAEGSARDATSLLDQAISHGAGETTADQVRAMLGLADRGRVLDLFDAIMRGAAAEALSELSRQYADGADPVAILSDLAEVTHWVSVTKITPDAADDPTIAPDERDRGRDMANRLPMRSLTRMWQMLLKALEEVAAAPNAMMAAEMAVIRLTHVADLPPPDELIRKLKQSPAPTGQAPTSSPQATPQAPRAQATGAAQAAVQAQSQPGLAAYPTFDSVIALIQDHRDMHLQVLVENHLRLVSYSPGRITFTPTPDAPPDLASQLNTKLQRWTGERWAVTIAEGGAPSLREQRTSAETERLDRARAHPGVAAVLKTLPNAKLIRVDTIKAPDQAAAEEALPEVPDEWDPFETD
ncbi:MAG: DNA polymerase III subunit gamma/tau [Pseudomonadota bacterium]